MLIASVGPPWPPTVPGTLPPTTRPTASPSGKLDPLVRPHAGDRPRQTLPPGRTPAQRRRPTHSRAAALANGRASAGEDYTAFHTMMALAGLHMAQELARGTPAPAGLQSPRSQRGCLQGHAAQGGRHAPPVKPADLAADKSAADALARGRDRKDMARRPDLRRMAAGKPKTPSTNFSPPFKRNWRSTASCCRNRAAGPVRHQLAW